MIKVNALNQLSEVTEANSCHLTVPKHKVHTRGYQMMPAVNQLLPLYLAQYVGHQLSLVGAIFAWFLGWSTDKSDATLVINKREADNFFLLKIRVFAFLSCPPPKNLRCLSSIF